MYGANFVLLSRHSAMYEHVLKWAIMCALDSRCISPTGSRTRCNFPKGYLSLEHSTYYVGGGCHRYDQSVLNVMLALYSNFTTDSLTHTNRCMKLERSSKSSVKKDITNYVQQTNITTSNDVARDAGQL